MKSPYTDNTVDAQTALLLEIQFAVALLTEIQAGLALPLVEEPRTVQVFPALSKKNRHLAADLEAMIK